MAQPKPIGKWARAAKELRAQTQVLNQAHVQMMIAFESNTLGTASDRLQSRARSVIAMRDACEQWLKGVDQLLDAAEVPR